MMFLANRLRGGKKEKINVSIAETIWSVRKVRLAYTGPCLQIRRASDNALLDVGFVNDELDIASATSFAGSASCYVRIWYDQSGNGFHLTQTSNSLQPLIISSGSMNLRGGKPAVYFNGDMLAVGESNIFRQAPKAQAFTVIHTQNTDKPIEQIVYVSRGTSTQGGRFNHVLNSGALAFSGRRLDSDSWQPVTSGYQALASGQQVTTICDYENQTVYLYGNGTIALTHSFQSAGSTSDTNAKTTSLGRYAAGSTAEDYVGTISEVILIKGESLLARAKIENSQMKYFGIL